MEKESGILKKVKKIRKNKERIEKKLYNQPNILKFGKQISPSIDEIIEDIDDFERKDCLKIQEYDEKISTLNTETILEEIILDIDKFSREEKICNSFSNCNLPENKLDHKKNYEINVNNDFLHFEQQNISQKLQIKKEILDEIEQFSEIIADKNDYSSKHCLKNDYCQNQINEDDFTITNSPENSCFPKDVVNSTNYSDDINLKREDNCSKRLELKNKCKIPKEDQNKYDSDSNNSHIIISEFKENFTSNDERPNRIRLIKKPKFKKNTLYNTKDKPVYDETFNKEKEITGEIDFECENEQSKNDQSNLDFTHCIYCLKGSVSQANIWMRLCQNCLFNLDSINGALELGIMDNSDIYYVIENKRRIGPSYQAKIPEMKANDQEKDQKKENKNRGFIKLNYDGNKISNDQLKIVFEEFQKIFGEHLKLTVEKVCYILTIFHYDVDDCFNHLRNNGIAWHNFIKFLKI